MAAAGQRPPLAVRDERSALLARHVAGTAARAGNRRHFPAMVGLLLSLALAAEPGPPRLLTSQVAAGVGVMGSSLVVTGTRLGETLLTPSVSGRVLLGGVVLEGGLLTSSSLVRGGAVFSLTGEARVGWSGERWAVTAGAIVQVSPEARPALQVLPTLRGSLAFGRAGLTLGVFDHFGLVPAHLCVDVVPTPKGRFGLGWVAPLGLLASGELALTEGFGVRVLAFGYRLGSAELAMLLVSGTFGGRR
jgi:hypothetical protein